MMGSSGSRISSEGAFASHASSGAEIRPNAVGRPGGLMRGSGTGLTHQRGAAVEHGQDLVRLGQVQIEDDARRARVAIAFDQVQILGHAEHRDRNGRGIAPGRDGHLLKSGSKFSTSPYAGRRAWGSQPSPYAMARRAPCGYTPPTIT